MRIISCAGYYRTGSSAVSDFFSEFENCYSLGNFEFRFLQDPDGIADLEYNIIDNNHRHNTGYAIKRYYRLAQFLNGRFYGKRYRLYFGNKFMEYTNNYINSITQLTCENWWHRDQIDRGELFYFIDKAYAKLNGIINAERNNTSLLRSEKAYYTCISREDFYRFTKEYTMNLFSCANKGNCDFVMVDQLVPPSNIEKYFNYIADMKAIVVERDPRDLYIIEKTRHRWGIMPYRNVDDFCLWYNITRRHRSVEIDNPEHVLRINFEDMIYKYDELMPVLISFAGMDEKNHIRKMEFFRPAVSKKNVHLFRSFPEYAEDIKTIEKALPEFLYKFPEDL